MARIMVIDDEPDIRQVISRFLSRRGHSVTLVSDGAYAMNEIRRNPPDLIILDILMPELGGCALCFHLKFKSEFAKIPIVILTSLTITPPHAKHIAADLFLTKPFDGEKLVDQVEKLLKRKQLKSALEPKAHAPAIVCESAAQA